MNRETSPFKRLIQYIQNHKIKSVFVGVGIFLIVFYCLVFFIPKPVQFSYGGDTCTPQLTLLPTLHEASDETKLKVSFKDELKIGSVVLGSMKTCFTAVREPKPGNLTMSTSPFGTFIARKNFSITVPSAPTARVANLDKPLPVSKPLVVKLSESDEVFSYQIVVDQAEADCAKQKDQLSCDIPGLNLKQGAKYPLSLERSFKEESKITLMTQSIEMLRAVAIKKSTLKNKQTIYSKPKSFSFTTDKPLANVEASVTTVEKKPQEIASTVEVKDKTLMVKLDKDLPREKEYRLTLETVEATDGSTLVEPEKITFKTSGGPKVTGVNIGKSRVGGSAVAVIQFDQKLSSDIDIGKYVSISGGKATIAKGSSSVTVALQGLPRCKSFTLNVASGIPSKYDIKAKGGWSYGSRTLCHSVITYGTSLKGRPLNAYIFGNSGPVTMYVGAIHGNEPSSNGLMRAWVEELENNAGRIGNRRIVVVPNINPDGVAANTRNNARNVNLSRNFPTDNWVKDINDTNGKVKGGGGKKPLSEPESSALARLTQQYRPRLLLSFHAIGSLVVGDPGGYSARYAAKYASMVGYRDATGAGGTFDYDITGAYEDWAYRNAGIPSMVIELGSYTSYYIDHHRSALWAML